MIDNDGFRPNVGIILTNDEGKVLWTKRVGQNAWQFPQGGIHRGESTKKALYRELYEEVGLKKDDVAIIGRTKGWLRYKLPQNFVRKNQTPLCIGQKQVWYILRVRVSDDAINFTTSDKPEFDAWEWVDYWYPLNQVIKFKRDVYRRALKQLEPKLQAYLAQRRKHAQTKKG